MPIPDDAPPEIPRIVLKSPEQGLELQVSLQRTDLYIHRRAATPLEADPSYDLASEILITVSDILGASPTRLAAIGSFFCRDDDPAMAISSHFCRENLLNGPLAGLENFEVHAHKRYELLEGLIVNSWLRAKTAEVTEAGRSSRAVLIERDINTLAEETRREFDPDAIRNFLREAGRKLGAEIEANFPAELSER